jgi:hypothetical protein
MRTFLSGPGHIACGRRKGISMRKKMLFLALALTALAASTSTSVSAIPPTSVPCGCTTYSDGSQCCVCRCDARGRILYCTDVMCPPADGGGIN